MKNINIVKGIAALVAALVGGWSMLLNVLVVMITIDIVTGLLAGFVEKQLSSAIGRKGIAGKVMIFLLVVAGHYVDLAIGLKSSLIMNAVIYFYIANELLSILENVGRVGLPLPDILKHAIKVLQGKSNVEIGSNND